MENVPYINCNVNINDDGDKLSIMIVNKHFTENLKVNLMVKGFNLNEKVTKVELTSDSPFDYNTIENRNIIRIIEKHIDDIKPNMNIELAAHSVTVLKLTRKS